jgi:hypothetical protein
MRNACEECRDCTRVKHISSKFTLFYPVEADTVCVDQIMTSELAHKKNGKI